MRKNQTTLIREEEKMSSSNELEIRRSGLDHSYIEFPHHYSPRRVFSTSGADWEQRINFDRLRQERLARAREAMKKYDLGAMVLFVGPNIRYITGVYQGNWKDNIFIRYAVLCRDSEPVLFETVGTDMEAAKIDSPWMAGRIGPAITWKWSEGAIERQAKNMVSGVVDILKERKVSGERIGIDNGDQWVSKSFEDAGIKLVNAWPAMSEARVVKTVDELECCKISAAIADACLDMVANEWLKRSGITERQLAGEIVRFFYNHGFEEGKASCVASGGNTNPYRRNWTDKIIRKGDLVITDLGGRGPCCGYVVDVTRTHICGDGAPTVEQKKLYQEVVKTVTGAISEAWPGKTTADSARHFPESDDDKYKSCSLIQFGHSIGLTSYEGMWVSRGFSFDYPAVFEPNMYMAFETYSGKPGLEQAVRLENNIVITENGPVTFTLYPFDEKFLD
jgi:Xaa-Pro aminopeptidase